jgi:D-3-phosphoglycerate dehydrogenase
MKTVITDYTFPDLEIERGMLEPLGHELVASQARPTAPELIGLVSDADAVLTQFARVDAEAIAAMALARVIVRYGIGVDNVDLDAARAHGIPVCNVPDYCLDEVADHTLAFILAVTRQVVPNCVAVREGRWGLAVPLDAMRSLRDLTVGVIGFGRIGREVVNRLRGFKCRVLVHDPFVAAEEIARAQGAAVSVDELCAGSDLITLHCPSTPETRGMIDRAFLAAARPGVVLINLARGDLVNPDDLTHALQTGQVAAAALDVFAPEPIPAEHLILAMPNVVVAPHVASASVRAVRTLRETAARLVALALRGESLPNAVNGITQPRRVRP